MSPEAIEGLKLFSDCTESGHEKLKVTAGGIAKIICHTCAKLKLGYSLSNPKKAKA